MDVKWLTISPASEDVTKRKSLVASSAVTKVNGYFEIPAFDIIPTTWYGHSRCLLQFNYSSPRNFTIPHKIIRPSGTVNYIACIKYRVGRVVTRYKLWENTWGKLNAPLYTGQTIKKNFIIEIWTASFLEAHGILEHLKSSLLYMPIYLWDTNEVRDCSPIPYGSELLFAIPTSFPIIISSGYAWINN